MTTTQKKLVVGLSVLVLGVSALFLRGEKAQEKVPGNTDGYSQPVRGDQTLGAVASPDVPSPWLRVGGVRQWYSRAEASTTGTTTPVTLQSPAATSTITYAACYSTVATSSLTKWVISRAATRNATTTPLGAGVTIQGTNRGLIIASTSPATNSLTTLPPNTFITWGLQGGDDTGGLNTYTPGGACVASFLEIQ